MPVLQKWNNPWYVHRWLYNGSKEQSAAGSGGERVGIQIQDNEGEVNEYLDVEIEEQSKNSYKLSQTADRAYPRSSPIKKDPAQILGRANT